RSVVVRPVFGKYNTLSKSFAFSLLLRGVKALCHPRETTMTTTSELPPHQPESLSPAETLAPAAPPAQSPTASGGPGVPAPATIDGISIPGYEIISTLGRGGMGVV